MMCDFPGCTRDATHVLVDYYHTPIEDDDPRASDGRFFCAHHAPRDGRETCPVCVSFSIPTNVYDPQREEYVDLLRIYPEGTMDGQGCCSDHP